MNGHPFLALPVRALLGQEGYEPAIFRRLPGKLKMKPMSPWVTIKTNLAKQAADGKRGGR